MIARTLYTLIGLCFGMFLMWLSGFDFDHRGADTGLVCMIVVLCGFLGFCIHLISGMIKND